MARHSKDRVSQWYEHDVHLETRTLYIGDYNDLVVGPEMATNVVKAFHMFNTISIDKPVSIILNTCGGDWYYGMAIYDAIATAESEVSIYGTGCVMSMGSIIMQAAEHRYMYPHATMMIHDGTAGYVADTRSSINWSKHEEKLLNQMYAIYASRSSKPASFFKKLCSHDTILTAWEARDLGLIDYVVGEEDGEE
jgi:ATP-dependent Clp protease protease subunit